MLVANSSLQSEGFQFLRQQDPCTAHASRTICIPTAPMYLDGYKRYVEKIWGFLAEKLSDFQAKVLSTLKNYLYQDPI